MRLQGATLVNPWLTAWASIVVILSACYMLWMYQRTLFGEASEDLKNHMPDLTPREWAAIVPMVVMMFWMGIYTQTFLPPVSAANAKILDQTKVNVEYKVDAKPRTSVSEVASAR